MAKITRCGEFIGPGERRTAEYLEGHLPDSWNVICNKELVFPNGTTREIDFIILADDAIFVVDEKSWTRRISGNQQRWSLYSGESVDNPIKTVERQAVQLAGELRNDVPGLRRFVDGSHFVFGMVLLSDENVQTFLQQDPRARQQVVRLQRCEEYLAKYAADHGCRGVGQKFSGKLHDFFAGLPARPKVPERIGDYKVLKELPAHGPIRCYQAIHDSGVERQLKVVTKPTVLDHEEYERCLNLIVREYEALKELADARCVPHTDPFFSWDDGQLYVIPIQPVPGRSLRSVRQEDGEPSLTTVLRTSEVAFTSLALIHEARVLHRSIIPDRLILNEADVVFTDFSIARISGHQTIAPQVHELEPESIYSAPECRVDFGLAERASDVYSLAASIVYWVTGSEPPDDGQWPELLEQYRAKGDTPNAGAAFYDVMLSALSEDERGRPTTLQIVDTCKEARQGL